MVNRWSQGAPYGTTAIPYIGENGNWWVNQEDTGVKAQGPQGQQGQRGEAGIGVPGPALMYEDMTEEQKLELASHYTDDMQAIKDSCIADTNALIATAKTEMDATKAAALEEAATIAEQTTTGIVNKAVENAQAEIDASVATATTNINAAAANAENSKVVAQEAANSATATLESMQNIKQEAITAAQNAAAETATSTVNTLVEQAQADIDANITEAKNVATAAATNADASKVEANTSANSAAFSATAAANSATEANAAKVAAEAAANSVTLDADAMNAAVQASKSYAVGGTGTREGEDADNSKYYYGLCKTLAESGGSSYMGECAYADLPADATVGAIYKITDEFIDLNHSVVSDDPDYVKNLIGYSALVIRTADGKWEVLNQGLDSRNAININANARDIIELKDKALNDDIIVQAIGTEFNDTVAGGLNILNVYGKSEQVQYSGNNLLSPTLATTTTNGVTCTNNGDGTYTLNGTASADAVFNIIPNQTPFSNGTYKMVGCPIGGSESTFYLRGFNYGSSSGGRAKNDIGEGQIINVVDGMSFLRIYIISGTTVNNLVFKPMITTDLNAAYDDFEPYVGGIPSPSPYYPQKIKPSGTDKLLVTTHNADGSKGSEGYIPVKNYFSGIPVSSGGNYTDTNGQHWACDEIKYETVYGSRVGTRITRIAADIINGADNEAWIADGSIIGQYILNIPSAKAGSGVVCTQAIAGVADSLSVNQCVIDNYSNFIIRTDFSTIDDWIAHLQDSPILFLYELAEPEVIAFDEKESVAPCLLETFDESTTLTVTSLGAPDVAFIAPDIKVEYGKFKTGGHVLRNYNLLNLLINEFVSSIGGLEETDNQLSTTVGYTAHPNLLLPLDCGTGLIINSTYGTVNADEDGVITVVTSDGATSSVNMSIQAKTITLAAGTYTVSCDYLEGNTLTDHSSFSVQLDVYKDSATYANIITRLTNGGVATFTLTERTTIVVTLIVATSLTIKTRVVKPVLVAGTAVHLPICSKLDKLQELVIVKKSKSTVNYVASEYNTGIAFNLLMEKGYTLVDYRTNVSSPFVTTSTVVTPSEANATTNKYEIKVTSRNNSTGPLNAVTVEVVGIFVRDGFVGNGITV